MFIGDLAHHEIIMLRRPQIEFAFDTDSKQSAQSRMRVLRQLAQERIGVLSYHFAFPGIGHVAAEGDGFAWYALPWALRSVSAGASAPAPTVRPADSLNA